jgi:hypothetical protein
VNVLLIKAAKGRDFARLNPPPSRPLIGILFFRSFASKGSPGHQGKRTEAKNLMKLISKSKMG